MNQVIIFNKVNLIKFYTDIRTGRSGISRSGLALLCHKDLVSVWRLIDSLKERKFPNGILLPQSLNIEECIYHFNNEIYCNDELAIAIIFYYGLNNPELNDLLLSIINRGFNEWVADLTKWKTMYNRFDTQNYQSRMENAYQVLQHKSFLESCWKLESR